MIDLKDRRNLLAVRVGALFAFLHAMGSFIAWGNRAVARSVNSSDVGDGESLIRALGQPMLALHGWLVGKEPGTLGVLLLPFLFVNSILWGLVVALAARALIFRRRVGMETGSP